MKANNIVPLAKQHSIIFVTVLFGSHWKNEVTGILLKHGLGASVALLCVHVFNLCYGVDVLVALWVWMQWYDVFSKTVTVIWKNGENILTHFKDCNNLFHLENLLYNHPWILVLSWEGNHWSHHYVLQPAYIQNLPLPKLTCHYHFAIAFWYPYFISILYVL